MGGLLVGQVSVPELLEPVAVRGLARVLPQHEAVGLEADRSRGHDLVGLAVLQDSILVDSSLVSECVRADNGLIGLDLPSTHPPVSRNARKQMVVCTTIPRGQARHGTWMPVKFATDRLRRVSSVVSQPWKTGKLFGRTEIDIKTSSSDAFPARSPMPLIVTSTCRAPSWTAVRVLATARPRSLWQWVEKMAFSAPGVFSIRYL